MRYRVSNIRTVLEKVEASFFSLLQNSVIQCFVEKQVYFPSTSEQIKPLDHFMCTPLSIFLPMCFINDQVRPRKFHECILFYIADLVSCHDNIPIALRSLPSRTKHCFDHFFSRCLIPMKFHRLEGWSPTCQFVHPVTESRFWHDNQVWASNILVFQHIDQDRNRLKSLSQSHLID